MRNELSLGFMRVKRNTRNRPGRPFPPSRTTRNTIARRATEILQRHPPINTASLRLDNEELLVAEVDPAKVPAVVSTLRSAGQPGVFVTRPSELSAASGQSLHHRKSPPPARLSALSPVGAGYWIGSRSTKPPSSPHAPTSWKRFDWITSSPSLRSGCSTIPTC